MKVRIMVCNNWHFEGKCASNNKEIHVGFTKVTNETFGYLGTILEEKNKDNTDGSLLQYFKGIREDESYVNNNVGGMEGKWLGYLDSIADGFIFNNKDGWMNVISVGNVLGWLLGAFEDAVLWAFLGIALERSGKLSSIVITSIHSWTNSPRWEQVTN